MAHLGGRFEPFYAQKRHFATFATRRFSTSDTSDFEFIARVAREHRRVAHALHERFSDVFHVRHPSKATPGARECGGEGATCFFEMSRVASAADSSHLLGSSETGTGAHEAGLTWRTSDDADGRISNASIGHPRRGPMRLPPALVVQTHALAWIGCCSAQTLSRRPFSGLTDRYHADVRGPGPEHSRPRAVGAVTE